MLRDCLKCDSEQAFRVLARALSPLYGFCLGKCYSLFGAREMVGEGGCGAPNFQREKLQCLTMVPTQPRYCSSKAFTLALQGQPSQPGLHTQWICLAA